jgi:prophage regulatory protein
MNVSPEDEMSEVGGKDDRLLSWEQVRLMASISRSTAWRMERDGAFPRRVRVSPGRVGWWESELTWWKRTRSGPTPPPPPRKPLRTPHSPAAPSVRHPTPTSDEAPPAAAAQESPGRVDGRPKQRRKSHTNQIDFGF